MKPQDEQINEVAQIIKGLVSKLKKYNDVLDETYTAPGVNAKSLATSLTVYMNGLKENVKEWK